MLLLLLALELLLHCQLATLAAASEHHLLQVGLQLGDALGLAGERVLPELSGLVGVPVEQVGIHVDVGVQQDVEDVLLARVVGRWRRPGGMRPVERVQVAAMVPRQGGADGREVRLRGRQTQPTLAGPGSQDASHEVIVHRGRPP
uniref:Putative secreted protein n=1 Tax=Ixodes ricinus TaxID=34613 RepID=A0A6B0UUC3_IXORI